MLFIIILLIFIVLLFVTCVKVVPQANAYVVERLGAYLCTFETGIHFLVPFVDRVAKKVSLKEQVADFPPQPVITKDNVTMRIDSVVFFFITDPKLYAYGIVNPIAAIENLTATTLRNIIGDLDLDQTLTSREIIILRAEGEKKSTILVAEGKKEAAILDAEADTQTTILQAEAERQKQVEEAEGRAQAIRLVQQANAEGIRMLKEAGADEAVLKIKSLEAFAKAADGNATKIIVPSDIAGLAGIVQSVAELAQNTNTEKK